MKSMEPPSNHLSYQNQMQIPKQLKKLKSLIRQETIVTKGQSTEVIKENVEFAGKGLDEQDKIGLLMWIFHFALGYKHGKPTKFDQSLHANIQHCMRRIHRMDVPPPMVTNFMDQLRLKYKKTNEFAFCPSHHG